MRVVSFVMLVIFPIGVPVALGWILWRKRHALYPRNADLVMSVSHCAHGVQSSALTVRLDKVMPEMLGVLHTQVRRNASAWLFRWYAKQAPACLVESRSLLIKGSFMLRDVACPVQVQALGCTLASADTASTVSGVDGRSQPRADATHLPHAGQQASTSPDSSSTHQTQRALQDRGVLEYAGKPSPDKGASVHTPDRTWLSHPGDSAGPGVGHDVPALAVQGTSVLMVQASEGLRVPMPAAPHLEAPATSGQWSRRGSTGKRAADSESTAARPLLKIGHPGDSEVTAGAGTGRDVALHQPEGSSPQEPQGKEASEGLRAPLVTHLEGQVETPTSGSGQWTQKGPSTYRPDPTMSTARFVRVTSSLGPSATHAVP
jgi:hypothetical protein